MIVKNMIGLAPGVTTTCSADTETPRVSLMCFAIASRSSGSPARRAVVRGARIERTLGGGLDVLGRVEVGLSDLEVHDLLALALQRPRAREHLERRFRSQPSHPLRDIHGAHYILVDFVEVG